MQKIVSDIRDEDGGLVVFVFFHFIVRKTGDVVMKKLFVIFLLCMACVNNIEAQKLGWGVKGGMNLSTMVGDVDNAEAKFGLHTGVLMELKFTEGFSLMPELTVSMQGAKETYSHVDENRDYAETTRRELSMTYLAFPVLAQVKIWDGLSIHAGPQYSLLLGVESETEFITISEGEQSSEVFKNDSRSGFTQVDVALILGATYDTDWGLFFQARYCQGIMPVYQDDLDGSAGSFHAVLQVGTGFKF